MREQEAAYQVLSSEPDTKLHINIMTISSVITACLYDLAVGPATHGGGGGATDGTQGLKALGMLGKYSTTEPHSQPFPMCLYVSDSSLDSDQDTMSNLSHGV